MHCGLTGRYEKWPCCRVGVSCPFSPSPTTDPFFSRHMQTHRTFLPGGNKRDELLEKLGIVHELTGRQRNRLFVHDRYLQILSEGTEPFWAYGDGRAAWTEPSSSHCGPYRCRAQPKTSAIWVPIRLCTSPPPIHSTPGAASRRTASTIPSVPTAAPSAINPQRIPARSTRRGSACNTHDVSLRNHAIVSWDGRAETRTTDAYSLQYVERGSGEPAPASRRCVATASP